MSDMNGAARLARFEYQLKAHPTRYADVLFRSRLEARWAAFFDLAGWYWEYEPFDLPGWTPDFYVRFLCGHSECPEHHDLLIEVKPFASISQFEGHPALDYLWGSKWVGPEEPVSARYAWPEEEIQKYTVYIPADSSAAFGNNPDVTYWEMCHGAGGGVEDVKNWIGCRDAWELWKEAGLKTRFEPK